MRYITASSLEVYADWYLHRDARKPPPRNRVPETPEGRVAQMWMKHEGKMRTWFRSRARWSIVNLENEVELGNLVFLESHWTRVERLVIPGGVNYRLLTKVADNAIASNYLARDSAAKHRNYSNLISRGQLRFEGDERIAICTAEESEQRTNPAADYYLLDGTGRCLPYMMLLKTRAVEFAPVEAFLAERLV